MCKNTKWWRKVHALGKVNIKLGPVYTIIRDVLLILEMENFKNLNNKVIASYLKYIKYSSSINSRFNTNPPHTYQSILAQT